MTEEEEAEAGGWSSSTEEAKVFSQWQMVRWAEVWWKTEFLYELSPSLLLFKTNVCGEMPRNQCSMSTD